jgi:hypothetical protein
LWASLVLKVDRNPTQLVLHLVFIFYLIYNWIKCF